MKMVCLPYICVSKERLEIIQSALKNLGYPQLIEIPLLNKTLGIIIDKGREEGFIAYTTKDIREIEILREKYGGFHIGTIYYGNEYYFVTSLELYDGEII